MSESNKGPQVEEVKVEAVKVEEGAAKSSSYTMAVLSFAGKQFFAAFAAVPTIYKAVYPAQTAEELKAAADAVAQLEKEAADAKTRAEDRKKALDAITAEGDAKNQAQAAFDAADKAAKDAQAKVSSSFMKAIKTGLNYTGRFVVGTISTPFWIALQALNFVAYMVVALASLVAVVPTAGVEGVAYAVNGMISGLSYVGEKIGLIKPKETRIPQTPQGAGAGAVDRNANKTDNQGPEVKPDYTLVHLVEEGIVVADSAIRNAAKVLIEHADANLSAQYDAITAECFGLVDAKKDTRTLTGGAEHISAGAVVEQIKVYLASHENKLPKSAPKPK